MRKIFCFSVIYFFISVFYCNAAEDPASVFKSVNWLHGPNTAYLGPYAEIKISPGYMFANGNDTRRLLEATQNIPSGKELGLVGTQDLSYFIVFSFDDTGHINDNEKDDLNADTILNQFKKNSVESNRERQKRGWGARDIVGWAIPPRYNLANNNLEWAIKYKDSKGQEIINFSTRYLGRTGVMKAILVSDPTELSSVLPKYESIMSGFNFSQGNRYAEFVKGDKVAEYGLSALIVGGAAAAAVKSGFGKYIGKFIIGIGVVILASVQSTIKCRIKTP